MFIIKSGIKINNSITSANYIKKAFTKRSDVLDLAIDSEGRIVVLDLKAGVLQRFARKTEMSGGL